MNEVDELQALKEKLDLVKATGASKKGEKKALLSRLREEFSIDVSKGVNLGERIKELNKESEELQSKKVEYTRLAEEKMQGYEEILE